MSFSQVVESIGKAVDVGGVAIIVIGGLLAFASTAFERNVQDRYRTLRRRLGRSILLGLELLVAADIIRTVAVRPNLSSVGVLAIIVAVRTFLSFSLELEITGRWPWQKSPATNAMIGRPQNG